ncbi:hypothetical protein CNYM01_10883 [Colletotrichum nymphaeae SA-01]|uniref:Uncharacterized protein n=1 Tax=Colletotrichum nymphaeae SA-01 TaxID=1460502 RepID=A0A135S6J1_9PEZI|nr:hypothetical protein CNYM01_10883 [Colletotrichum nymphaeae SA-01]
MDVSHLPSIILNLQKPSLTYSSTANQQAISTFSFGNLGWLATQAVPLIIWPRFITNLLRPDDYQYAAGCESLRHPPSTHLVLRPPNPRSPRRNPLRSSTPRIRGPNIVAHTVTSQTAPAGTVSPYANAALILSSIHHASAGFYCYSRWLRTGQTAFALGCLGSAVFAVSGLWCLMFAGDKSRRSKKHGYDKDTSSFPFKNTESYRSKKKGL